MHSKTQPGFTLVELMITVAIVAILAAIAYPSYQSHVLRTHRAAAKACLSEHAQFMERYYTTKLTYVGANPVLGCSTESRLDERYTIAVSGALTRTTYLLEATPKSVQAKDAECGKLSIDQTGARKASGTGGAAKCW